MNELSLDDINSKSPYLVKRSDDGDYVFQTAKGVIYGIGFIENDPLGGCETYQLSISNQNKKHASYDPDVKNTTLIIVEEFFAKNLDGLLYMCDTSDSREAARNRLFMRQDFVIKQERIQILMQLLNIQATFVRTICLTCFMKTLFTLTM